MFNKFVRLSFLVLLCFPAVGCHRQVQNRVNYLKNYSPPSYLIDSVYLTIDLKDTNTTVDSVMKIRMNPNALKKTHTLILDGEKQQLKSVKLNGRMLTAGQYRVNDKALIIKNTPAQFTLEIVSTNNPFQNTELSGIYKSHGLFISQCEAEGFRKITYFLDRPDVLSLYTVKLIADKTLYPVLLSNGNLIKHGNLSDDRHYVVWRDPFKKPSYLFAIVAGDLAHLEGSFQTLSGKTVRIYVYALKDRINRCHFALKSIKNAMHWDEKTYGREYDLNRFNLVAVPDFTAGAMENKSLNIFNDKYVLADPKSATDQEYEKTAYVIAHEYFHNWSGDRVTLRDWFQLTLKEGLTVFRQQSFNEDMTSKVIARIEDANYIRSVQFVEDSSPLSRPIRPDSYIAPDNLYTATVYDKGAEVIRMLRTLLGPMRFRKGMDVYFSRYDGQAVTCDDFINTMAEVSGMDLLLFKRWYSQSGTPELFIKTPRYDAENKNFYLTVKQILPKTKKQPYPKPMMIPLRIGLLGKDRQAIVKKPLLLIITKRQQTFTIKNVVQKPIVSLLRGFSAPVKIHYPYTDQELRFLMQHDGDGFARWNASRLFFNRLIQSLLKKQQAGEKLTLPGVDISVLKTILLDKNIEKNLAAKILAVPSETEIEASMKKIDSDAVHAVRQFLVQSIAKALKVPLLKVYHENTNTKPYHYDPENVGQRRLRNFSLYCLTSLDTAKMRQLALKQFQQADNMTDKMGALLALNNIKCIERKTVLNQFYNTWKDDPLVLDKWFMLQASSTLPSTIEVVKKMLAHPKFNIKNPNNVYALLITFSISNPYRFNQKDGAGYKLLANQIIKIDSINKYVAARLMRAFESWKKLDKSRQRLIQQELNRILKTPNLSKNVYEMGMHIKS